jgi:hypothetical protein
MIAVWFYPARMARETRSTDFRVGEEASEPEIVLRLDLGPFSFRVQLGREKISSSFCHKFFPLGDSQIPLNPPLAKGDFTSNSLKFPPFSKGGIE